MSTMISTAPLTTDQFIDWSAVREHSYELIDGIPTLVPPENYFNTTIARFLERYLATFFAWHRLSRDLEIELDTGNTRIPDLCVVSNETARRLRRMTRAIIRLGAEPPAIVVEIVSPDSGRRDYEKKLSEYAVVNVSEYWILDPATRAAMIYRLSTDGHYLRVETSTETGTTASDLTAIIDEADTELG
ncbi:MAG: Uma2 family endonuclease [Cyanobacteria bacterium P01_H01_bin.121]